MFAAASRKENNVSRFYKKKYERASKLIRNLQEENAVRVHKRPRCGFVTCSCPSNSENQVKLCPPGCSSEYIITAWKNIESLQDIDESNLWLCEKRLLPRSIKPEKHHFSSPALHVNLDAYSTSNHSASEKETKFKAK